MDAQKQLTKLPKQFRKRTWNYCGNVKWGAKTVCTNNSVMYNQNRMHKRCQHTGCCKTTNGSESRCNDNSIPKHERETVSATDCSNSLLRQTYHKTSPHLISGFSLFYGKKSWTFQDRPGPREKFSRTFSEPEVSNSQHELGAILLLLVFHLNHWKKCTTFKDIFPGLARTLSFNFQYFPGPGNFTKKIQDVPEISRRRGNPVTWTDRCKKIMEIILQSCVTLEVNSWKPSATCFFRHRVCRPILCTIFSNKVDTKRNDVSKVAINANWWKASQWHTETSHICSSKAAIYASIYAIILPKNTSTTKQYTATHN